jgi:hypothetical protein
MSRKASRICLGNSLRNVARPRHGGNRERLFGRKVLIDRCLVDAVDPAQIVHVDGPIARPPEPVEGTVKDLKPSPLSGRETSQPTGWLQVEIRRKTGFPSALGGPKQRQSRFVIGRNRLKDENRLQIENLEHFQQKLQTFALVKVR